MKENNEVNEKEKNAEEKASDEAVINENASKEKKSKMSTGVKLMIAAIVILVAAVAVLSVFLFKEKNKGQGDGLQDAASTEDVNDIATNTDGTEQSQNSEEANTEDEDAETPLCYVVVTKGSGWENGDKYSCQLDAIIYNDTDREISDWEVRMDFGSEFTMDNGWNGTYETDENVLYVTAVDYNVSVPAGGNIGFGCIVTAGSEDAIDNAVESSKLYVDGAEYILTYDHLSSQSDEDEVTEEDTENATPVETETGTPVDNHGQLSVAGTDIVDENGDKYQLKGVSTHGIAWFPDYVNKDAFQTLRDDWGANLIRLAMYTHENSGYCTDGDKEELKSLVYDGVEYATELGMYVIIDWHVLNEQNPLTYKDEALDFFDEMSDTYKDYENVIYEICNEPNSGAAWADVKSYAEEVIPVIRANDDDAIIIVGTPTWSQDVDTAAEDPIEGYDNIMYAAHFYAATHTDNIRNKVETAIEAGLPVIISEFSICDASGNGAIDYSQADKWFDLIDEYNLSYAGWSLSNKNETSALIKSSCTKTSGWTDDELSETGIWLKNRIKNDN